MPPTRVMRRVGRWAVVELGSALILLIYGGFIALLLAANFAYLATDISRTGGPYLGEIFRSADIRHAAWLTLWTSLVSSVLAILFAVPCAYALARVKIPGKVVFDMLVDTPIILPKIVVGVTLLVFFQTALGKGIQGWGMQFVCLPRQASSSLSSSAYRRMRSARSNRHWTRWTRDWKMSHALWDGLPAKSSCGSHCR